MGADVCLGHAQRHGARRVRLPRRRRDPAAGPGRRERARRGRRPRRYIEHRRGPAPLRRPRRRRSLPLLAVRDRRRQADVRLLRPAGPQGPLHPHRHRARRLEGRLERRPPRSSRPVRPRCTVSPPPRSSAPTSSRWSRARTRSGDASTSTTVPGSHPPGHLLPRLAGRAPGRRRLFTETKQGFDFYHRNFDFRYPFGKYDQLFVPEFNAGAMENAGAVTFLEDYVFRSRVTRSTYERRAETVLHEMAHMWFGDLVTMRWWDDLWLNESFATYASVLCQARPPSTRRRGRRSRTPRRAGPTARTSCPPPTRSPRTSPTCTPSRSTSTASPTPRAPRCSSSSSPTSGSSTFLAGLRAYFEAHECGNATFDDLLGALEKASGRDLSGWGEQWLKTTGLNLLRPVVRAGRRRRVHPLRRRAGRCRGPAPASCARTGSPSGSTTTTGPASSCAPTASSWTSTGERTAVPELVGESRGKLVLVNDDDLTYCAKLRLDPGSLRHADRPDRRHRGAAPPHACWSSAWDMTRDAELKARDFSALVAGGFGAETEIGVVQRLLLQAQTAIMSYADEQWAAERGWPVLVDALRVRLDTAEAGSDAQLAVVNSLAGSVLPEAVLERFRGWLSGVGRAGGADRRHGPPLAAAARTGRARVDRRRPGGAHRGRTGARRHVDRAAAGRAGSRADPDRGGEGARLAAGLPRRRAAERGATRRSSAASRTRRSARCSPPTSSATSRTSAGVWERRTSERAQPAVMDLFPAWAVDKATVDAADAWLADPDHPACPAAVGVGGPRRDRPGAGRARVRPVLTPRTHPPACCRGMADRVSRGRSGARTPGSARPG